MKKPHNIQFMTFQHALRTYFSITLQDDKWHTCEHVWPYISMITINSIQSMFWPTKLSNNFRFNKKCNVIHYLLSVLFWWTLYFAILTGYGLCLCTNKHPTIIPVGLFALFGIRLDRTFLLPSQKVIAPLHDNGLHLFIIYL